MAYLRLAVHNQLHLVCNLDSRHPIPSMHRIHLNEQDLSYMGTVSIPNGPVDPAIDLRYAWYHTRTEE